MLLAVPQNGCTGFMGCTKHLRFTRIEAFNTEGVLVQEISMVHVIERGRTFARIRASWRTVQRACWDEKKRYSDKCHLDMEGGENLLTGGAKAYKKTNNGIWVISGYAADGSDVKTALDAMKVSWTDNLLNRNVEIVAA